MSKELDWFPFHQIGEPPLWLLVTQKEKADYRASNLFHCEHEETEWRDRTIKGGGLQRIRQCLLCGKAHGTAKKIDAALSATLWDTELTDGAKFKMEQHRERIYNTALDRTVKLETDGTATYEEYLASDAWKLKRRVVLERDDNLCQACLSRDATEVHHLTYERIFEEPMFDLVAICRTCHEKLHRKKIAAFAASKAKSSDIPEPP